MTPGIPLPVAYYGRQLMQEGRYAEAAVVLEGAIRRDPGDASLNDSLAKCYFLCERFEDAIHQHRLAIDQAPEEPTFLFNLGVSYARLGRYHESVRCFKQVLGMVYPGMKAVVHLYLGENFGELGMKLDANQEYRRAIEEDPSMFRAYFRLAEGYLDADDAERGVNLLLKGFTEFRGLKEEPYSAQAVSALLNEVNSPEKQFADFWKSPHLPAIRRTLDDRLDALNKDAEAAALLQERMAVLDEEGRVAFSALAGILDSGTEGESNSSDPAYRLMYGR